MAEGSRQNYNNVIEWPEARQRIPSRLLVIGQAPARTDDRGPASAHARFARMLGIHPDQLWQRWSLFNLNAELRGTDGRFDQFELNEAQRRAGQIEARMRRDPYDVVLVWGRAVADVVGAPMLGWTTERRGARWMGAIPHPSGANRWWNDLANRDLASAYLMNLGAYLEGTWPTPEG